MAAPKTVMAGMATKAEHHPRRTRSVPTTLGRDGNEANLISFFLENQIDAVLILGGLSAKIKRLLHLLAIHQHQSGNACYDELKSASHDPALATPKQTTTFGLLLGFSLLIITRKSTSLRLFWS